MLTPKCLPPIPGIQSGVVKLILFKPSIAILISPITEFRGALITEPNPLIIPLKISTTPCQALLQFPVNTPVTKSIIPPNIFLID